VQFKSLVDNATDLLNKKAARDSEYYLGRNAQKLEIDVKNALDAVAENTPFQGTIDVVSGQKFPDIVAAKYYGVEVKSSKDDKWQTIGGSVNESTRVEDVERIFLTFGKLLSPVEFRSRAYEECLSGMAVTHYPRYKIDMNLQNGETLFDHMGTTYDKLRTSEFPVESIINYYKSQMGKDERLWWAGNEELSVDEMKVRLANTLTVAERQDVIAWGFALFPEVTGKSSKKYEQFVLWLAATRHVVSPSTRDFFSAGGRGTLVTRNGIFENLPKVVLKIDEHKDAIALNILTASEDDLMKNWNVKHIAVDRIGQWIDCVANIRSLDDYDTHTVLDAIFRPPPP